MRGKCNDIASDILKNCTALVPGVKDVAYFINIEDIDKDLCTFHTDYPLLITDLVLNCGTRIYKVEGYNYSHEHKREMLKMRYGKKWDHLFTFRIFDNTPEDNLWMHVLLSFLKIIIIS
jgi:hypothetical protein